MDTYPHSTGAGPMLIKDGNLVLDAVKEGFTGENLRPDHREVLLVKPRSGS